MMTRASLLFAIGALVLTAGLATLTGFAAGGDAGVAPAGPPLSAADAGASLSNEAAVAQAEDVLEDAAQDVGDDDEEGDGPLLPSRKMPPLGRATSIPAEQDVLLRARAGADGRLRAKVGGREELLTIEKTLQDRLTEVLRSYETPYAAVVAIEPSTGRVLAMAEHSQASPGLRGLSTRALFPAASIFKIVTAAALLEAGVSPSSTECSHGGKRRVGLKHLEDSSRDRVCHSLTQALALSANGVFAKFTHKHLEPKRLTRVAEAFHFNRPFSFPMPTDVSAAVIPSEPLAFAQTGAGFGDVFLSPLHGALLASVAANGGVWREPVLLESALEAPAAMETGAVVLAGADAGSGAITPAVASFGAGAGAGGRVLSKRHAAALADMLEATVTQGTARRVFRERGYRVSGAAGKTGSLADKKPFRDYSWFVGFAPKEAPRVAVAAVIVNDMRWRIRATWLGREAMRYALELPRNKAPAAREKPVSAPSRWSPARSR